jgi:arginase
MDGLDPLDAPGVGTPVPNGLRLLPTLALLRALAARRPILSADLVELDPSLDPSGRTVSAALSLVEALFGP